MSTLLATSPTAIAVLVLLAKVTAIFALAGVVALATRRSSAAVRHDIWAGALAAAVLVALLAPVTPRLPWVVAEQAATPTPAPPSEAASPRAPLPALPQVVAAPPSAPPTAPDRARGGRRALPMPLPWLRAPALLAAVWIAGTLALLLWCVAGRLALRRLERRARVLDDGSWQGLLATTATLAGVTRPVRLLASDEVATPLTWSALISGLRRPRVMMPAAAEGWPLERRRAALLHELAHVARHDAAVQLAGTLACCLYWFHPASWLALRRLRAEAERACDDRVLAAGTAPPEYASQLLAVASGARAQRLAGAAVAIGMARPSTLEGRLLAVLDERLPRRPARRATRLIAGVVAVAALLPLAALTPVARAATPVRAASAPMSHTLRASAAVGHAAATVLRATTTTMTIAPSPARDSAAGPASTIERTVDASPSEELRLDLDTGAGITVTGWDEPRVEVLGQLGGRDWRDTRLTVEREGSAVVVRTRFAGSNGGSTSHRLAIHVPRKFDVSLQSAGGDLSLDGLEGTFRGSTGGGQLTLRHLQGAAQLSTGGGDIRVTDCTLSGSVSTGGGTVAFSRVAGGLRGASGSGPVIHLDPAFGEGGDESAAGERASGDLEGTTIDHHGNVSLPPDAGTVHMSSAGGDIHLAEAPHGADVSTGGGDIVIGAAGGAVKATTGGGDVTIGPVTGSVIASTGAGRVEVTLAPSEAPKVDVGSGSGAVIVTLPAGFDGTLDLETAYTESFGRETHIVAPGNLTRETTGWKDDKGTPRRYVRARGALGNGPGVIKVRTVNGDVEVRRAG